MKWDASPLVLVIWNYSKMTCRATPLFRTVYSLQHNEAYRFFLFVKTCDGSTII